MQNMSITIKTNKEVKDKVKNLCAELGMYLTAVVNELFRQFLFIMMYPLT